MDTKNPSFESPARRGIIDRIADQALRLLLSRKGELTEKQDAIPENIQREEVFLSLAQLASRQLVVPSKNTDLLSKSIDQISRESYNQEQLGDLITAITQPYEQLFVSEASKQPRTYFGDIKHGRWSHDFRGPKGTVNHTASYYYTKKKRAVSVEGAQVMLESAFDSKYTMPTMDLELQDNRITDIELKWSHSHPTVLLQNHAHSPLFDFLSNTIPLDYRPYVKTSIQVSMANKAPSILVDSPVIAGDYCYPLTSSFEYSPEANMFIRHMSNPSGYKRLHKDRLQGLTVSEYGQVVQGLLDLIPNADISRVALDE